MARPNTFESERETIESHEEESAAEQLYNQRFTDRSALYNRPPGADEQQSPVEDETEEGGEQQSQPAGEAGQSATSAKGSKGEQDDVQNEEGADRVSQLYQKMRVKARAKQAIAAAKEKVKKAATSAAKKFIIEAILPYVIPALIIIGVILAIGGIAIYLTTLVPGVGV
ncbi:hypothetical protein BK004_03965 [bacterium CG10_46_32]|nr:MAG: hypothetical protein BK004_03965 [bacterium CG10_46_32]PIR55851.1 MAG: hypothetical protein COU73_04000 [Parcubacteria group bacterium CG10_big_fil_rev_8_21_14_0_10_46_32]